MANTSGSVKGQRSVLGESAPGERLRVSGTRHRVGRGRRCWCCMGLVSCWQLGCRVVAAVPGWCAGIGLDRGSGQGLDLGVVGALTRLGDRGGERRWAQAVRTVKMDVRGNQRLDQAMGFRRFSFRGLEKIGAEWMLVCLALKVKRRRDFRLREAHRRMHLATVQEPANGSSSPFRVAGMRCHVLLVPNGYQPNPVRTRSRYPTTDPTMTSASHRRSCGGGTYGVLCVTR